MFSLCAMVRHVRQWFRHSVAVEMVVNGVLRTLWKWSIRRRTQKGERGKVAQSPLIRWRTAIAGSPNGNCRSVTWKGFRDDFTQGCIETIRFLTFHRSCGSLHFLFKPHKTPQKQRQILNSMKVQTTSCLEKQMYVPRKRCLSTIVRG